jgi:hypothetical protein
LLSLLSCSFIEYDKALHSYKQAKLDQNLSDITSTLTTLAKLKPEKHKAQLNTVIKANVQLQQAQEYFTNGDFYNSYLLSHGSYRSVPSIKAKVLLSESATPLLPILKAQLSIEKSFQYTVLLLPNLFENYEATPISHWDLVKVNTILEQLGRSIKALDYALNIIESRDIYLPDSQLTQWEKKIEQQRNIITLARDYLPTLAKSRSAKILLELNQSLTNESINLLSLVSPALAKQTIQSSFYKAQVIYSPFQEVIENISLAMNLNSKDVHANWYQGWNRIEINVLELKDDFTNYPRLSKHRIAQLNQQLENEKVIIPKIVDNLVSKKDFNQQLSVITGLVEKLKQDKALLN